MEAQGIWNKEFRDLITECLEGNEQGMRELLTWFLNQVMEYEAEQQSGAGRYVRGEWKESPQEWIQGTNAQHKAWTAEAVQAATQGVSIQNKGLRNILTCGECTHQRHNGIVSAGCSNKGCAQCCGTAGCGECIAINSVKDGKGTGCSSAPVP